MDKKKENNRAVKTGGYIMGKCHRVILKDKNGELLTEIRYSNTTGLLYRQNRSQDREIAFDDFLDRLKKTKQQVKKQGHILECDLIEDNELWKTKKEVIR